MKMIRMKCITMCLSFLSLVQLSQAQVGTIFDVEGLSYEVKSIIPNHVEVKANLNPSAEDVNIPYNVSHGLLNYLVESVGPRSFEFNSLKTVKVSHAVNWLKTACFRQTKLQRFECPDELYDIFDAAFEGCTELDTVVTNRMLKRIHQYAFKDCEKLKFIEFPNTLETIEAYAFQECNFVNLTLPDVPFVMGEGAFNGCDSLLELNLGNGIVDIPKWAFNEHRLPEIIIPDQVRTIGYAAFKRQSTFRPLQRIILGSNVNDIAMYAFLCSFDYVKEILCKAEVPPTCHAQAFDEMTYDNGTLYVPKECADAYKTDPTWGKFQNIIEMDMANIQNMIDKKERSSEIYSLSGIRLTHPTHGIKVIDQKKIIVK